jgi:hypothetical protein
VFWFAVSDYWRIPGSWYVSVYNKIVTMLRELVVTQCADRKVQVVLILRIDGSLSNIVFVFRCHYFDHKCLFIRASSDYIDIHSSVLSVMVLLNMTTRSLW